MSRSQVFDQPYLPGDMSNAIDDVLAGRAEVCGTVPQYDSPIGAGALSFTCWPPRKGDAVEWFVMADIGPYAVLIVEDEALLALDLHLTLEAAGYAVIGCPGTVAGAKAMIERSSPDAVVLDIVLRSGPDFEVADFLADRGIPFLFVTVCDRLSIPERHLERPLLAKPCTAEQLVPALKGILRRGDEATACVAKGPSEASVASVST